MANFNSFVVFFFLVGSIMCQDDYTKISDAECESSGRSASISCLVNDNSLRNSELSAAINIRKPIEPIFASFCFLNDFLILF